MRSRAIKSAGDLTIRCDYKREGHRPWRTFTLLSGNMSITLDEEDMYRLKRDINTLLWELDDDEKA